MNITNIEVFNFKGALRGMRNPLNSHSKSDTNYGFIYHGAPLLGPNDYDLAMRLINAGPEHRKFLRQIFVSMDITAPFYWWKEFDTYKIGTTANSGSTMHTLHKESISPDMFETPIRGDKEFLSYLDYLEKLRKEYVETKNVDAWKQLVQCLPSSWLQTRTWTGNYEILRNICTQRAHHKLTEWHYFCDTIKEQVPYAKDFIFIPEGEEENEKTN